MARIELRQGRTHSTISRLRPRSRHPIRGRVLSFATSVLVAGATSATRGSPGGSAKRGALDGHRAPAVARGSSHQGVAESVDRVRRHDPGVPRISAFYGIVIWMYHDEIHHLGRPHFHARYGDDEASIDIETLAVIAGGLPGRAVRLVTEWARDRQEELRENWELARRHQPLNSIAPLP
jgi:Domain of unknown function (DUF4160)